MSQEANPTDPVRELIEDAFATFNQGFADSRFDLESAARRLFAPDAEVSPRYARLEGRSLRGPEGAIAFVLEARRLFEQFEAHIEDVIGEGESRVVIYGIDARMRGSDVDLHQRLGGIFEVEGGKLAAMRVYGDPREALTAAGLEA